MADEPVISVIMGVFNPERDPLRRAVASIRNQTFFQWELVLWDDGSSPAGAQIIRQAAEQDSRIRLFRGEQNRGLAHALNEAVRQARGVYLARMDGDDVSLPRRLELQLRFLETHPLYQWVGSQAFLTDGRKVWGLTRVPTVPCRRDFLRSSPYVHPAVLFRRETLELAGGYEESSRVLGCEDYELFLRMHKLGYRGYNLPLPLLGYREDQAAYGKRTYGRRMREAALRCREFPALGLWGPSAWWGVLRPLAVGLVPGPLQYRLKRWRHAGREEALHG